MNHTTLHGTWESDRVRTLNDLRRKCGEDHKVTREFASDHSSLIMRVDDTFVTYFFRDMVSQAFYEVISCEGGVVETEVEPSHLNSEENYKMHFLNHDSYWIEIERDDGLTYKEYFRRLTVEEARLNLMDRAIKSWSLNEPSG